MKLYLTRHGETVDNVAQLYAGSTDSALTSHGHIQTTKLGSYFASSDTKFTHVFSSDLQRARKTAEAVVEAQKARFGKKSEKLKTIQLASLREQDFGSLERCSWVAHPRATRRHGIRETARLDGSDQNFLEVESKTSLSKRTGAFIDDYLIPIMFNPLSKRTEPVVLVVSHGMTLSALWKALLNRFALFSVTLAPGISRRKDGGDSLERIGGWSNTGYLELDIQHQPSEMQAAQATKGVVFSMEPSKSSEGNPMILYDWKMQISAVNSTAHLRGLKRTRGGVGSAKYDEDQKPLESYFSKRRRMQ